MIRILYVIGWIVAALMPLTDSDIWWQLACGRAMVEQGVFYREDPLTFTTIGQAWINVHWAYQWILYQIHQWNPENGTWFMVLFHAFLWGFGAWLWAGKKQTAWLLLLLPLVFLDRYLFLARPLALTLVLLGMQWRLYSSELPVWGRWLLILMLQVFLANIQGLFMLGPILWIFHSYLTRSTLRESLLGVIGLVAASAIHPWGPQVLLYPFALLGRIMPGNLFAERISENISPLRAVFSLDMVQWWQLGSCLVLILLGLWLWKRGQLPMRQAVICIPWFILAMLAERNIPIFLMLVLPVLAVSMDSSLNWKPGWKHGAWILIVLCILQASWWKVYPGPVSPFRFPEGAAEWLRQQGKPGEFRIFNDVRHGGYLSWSLGAKARTFVDGRLILRDSTFYASYLSLEQNPEAFHDLQQKHHFDYVLLPVGYPAMFQNLARQLLQDSAWRIVHLDGTSVLFSLCKPSMEPLQLHKSSVQDSILDAQNRFYRDFDPRIGAENRYWLSKAMNYRF